MPQQEKYPVLQQQKLLDYAAVSHPVLLRVQVCAAMLHPVSLFVLMCAAILHPFWPRVQVCSDVYAPALPEKRSSVPLQE